MITASPSIRALIPRVSDIAHLHCGALQRIGLVEPPACCSYCWSMQDNDDDNDDGRDEGLKKRRRMLDSLRVGWGGGQNED